MLNIRSIRAFRSCWISSKTHHTRLSHASMSKVYFQFCLGNEITVGDVSVSFRVCQAWGSSFQSDSRWLTCVYLRFFDYGDATVVKFGIDLQDTPDDLKKDRKSVTVVGVVCL